MVDKRDIGRDLSRLEDRIAPDADDADRVAAYWETLADAVRDAPVWNDDDNDVPQPSVNPPALEAFFPPGYDRDDVLDAFAGEDATWGDAVKQAAERRDQQDGVDTPDGGDTAQ